jgi:hypothetical protein
MLTEQIELILFTNMINIKENIYLCDWINELLHKNNIVNINCKLRYYYAIFLLCEKYKSFKKIILDIFQTSDTRCLYYDNMKLYFKKINSNINDLSQLIENVSNNITQDKMYYNYIKVIIFIDHLLTDTEELSNIAEDKLITQLKELLNDNTIISFLINTNLSLNLLKHFLKKN